MRKGLPTGGFKKRKKKKKKRMVLYYIKLSVREGGDRIESFNSVSILTPRAHVLCALRHVLFKIALRRNMSYEDFMTILVTQYFSMILTISGH